MTKEMGKPIRDSIAEAEKCAWMTDYYNENAPDFLRDENVKMDNKEGYVTFNPLGIVLAIMPWNFPFWQVIRCAVPAILAGNSVVLKHASNVPISALEIENIFKEAGFPKGVFTTLLIDSQTAMKLVDEDMVDAVSLTGSLYAGSRIGELAGKRVKKIVLELGGSDPFIVLEDADINAAAKAAALSRMANAGQSCIAAKRFIVIDSVAEKFQKKFIEEIKKFKVGDPMDESTDIGPVSKKSFADDLKKQLQDAKGKGAKIASGKELPYSRGYFFTPCVVTQVTDDMKVVSDEVFGPIAPVITVKTEKEAIKKANDTIYGLGSAVWTKNIKRAKRLAKEINSGFVAVNSFTSSDPRLPFGGIKKSGIGRELGSYGIKEFVNIKTVTINK